MGSLDTFYSLTLLFYSARVYSVCFTSPVLTFTVLLLHGSLVEAIMTPVCRLRVVEVTGHRPNTNRSGSGGTCCVVAAAVVLADKRLW